jgi:hypothetical protein
MAAAIVVVTLAAVALTVKTRKQIQK